LPSVYSLRPGKCARCAAHVAHHKGDVVARRLFCHDVLAMVLLRLFSEPLAADVVSFGETCACPENLGMARKSRNSVSIRFLCLAFAARDPAAMPPAPAILSRSPPAEAKRQSASRSQPIDDELNRGVLAPLADHTPPRQHREAVHEPLVDDQFCWPAAYRQRLCFGLGSHRTEKVIVSRREKAHSPKHHLQAHTGQIDVQCVLG